MEELTKKVVKDILKVNLQQEVAPLGDIVAKTMFGKGKLAMAIHVDGRNDFLLFPPTTSNKVIQKSLLQITDLCATLSFLEKNKQILLIAPQELESKVFYERTNILEADTIPHVFNLSDSCKLTTNDTEGMRIINEGRLELVEYTVSSEIIKSLSRYMCSTVLPTKALETFKQRGYKTTEEHLTRRGLRISLWSVVIAVVIALASLLGTVWIGNKHGISTINKEQFDRLIHSIEKSKK